MGLTLRNTLHFRIVLAVGALTLAIAVVAAAFFYSMSNRRLIEGGLARVDRQLAVVDARFSANIEELIRDTRMMSATPPIQGLARATNNDGFDPQDDSTDAQWRARLQVLFTGLLDNKPAYLQGRYIGAADGGRELVRVQRAAVGDPVLTVGAASMQRKSAEPYFRAAVALAPGEVFVSNINLNRENGRIQEPHVPVVRAATPIVDESTGEPFGVVVLNLHASLLSTELTTNVSPDERRYVIDSEGHYIVHPDPDREYGFEGDPGAAYRDFPRLEAVMAGTDPGSAQIVGDRIVAMRRVRLGPLGASPSVGLVVERSLASFTRSNAAATGDLLPVMGVLVVVSLGLGILLARSAVRPMAQLAEALRGMDVAERRLERPAGLTGEAASLADSLEHAVDALRAADRVEANNRHLRQLVYVASHDLQEPARTVRSFAELLVDEYLDQFDEDGRQSLQYLLRGATRMQTLIKALLDHGRLGLDARRVSCDLDALVAAVVEDLRASLDEQGAVVEVGPLGTMNVYRVELRSLFQNLISNALKFHSGPKTPRITISATSTPTGKRFEVCDNGPGIAADKREEVFMMFRRLHGRDEVAGVGIGLADCRKIVELHGGDIRVTDAPGGGACFIFGIDDGKA